ncbi:cytochrome c-type biogenesis CcmF C-terminal domain-containing protein [Methanohalophilus sp.]|uniref:cytochrome c-type biogenesis CcmF C-terminal domain-containing protein n=1 Tax=Methanohalophilus sp. TaxID=1966352 RepID=UPI00262E3680|nr:cytochrome c-type biogenesis CcmF C-terminal domain-containing protein [Methanohalophilus sp.]MDK2892678.1 hypothetical protein [Methanohalophilus sp.]
MKLDFNLLSKDNLVSATVFSFAVLVVLLTIGMLTPLVIKLTSGMEISMSAEYFNLRTAPFAILLVLLLSACILVEKYSQKQVFMFVGGEVIASLLFLLASPTGDWKTDLVLPMFIGTVLVVLYRLVKIINERSGKVLLRGIGAHVIHIGILLIIFGVIVSSTMKIEESAIHMENIESSFEDIDYSIMVTDMTSDYEGNPYREYPGSSYITHVEFDVYKNGAYFDSGTLDYVTDIKWRQTYTTTYINRGLFEELFIAPRALDEKNNKIDLYVRVVPFITFVWAGNLMMLLGMIILLAQGLLPKGKSHGGK